MMFFRPLHQGINLYKSWLLTANKMEIDIWLGFSRDMPSPGTCDCNVLVIHHVSALQFCTGASWFECTCEATTSSFTSHSSL